MLLRALEDLENILTSWKWDYFINISESDYPLKYEGGGEGEGELKREGK